MLILGRADGEDLKAASQQFVHATDNPHEMDPADQQLTGKEGYTKQRVTECPDCRLAIPQSRFLSSS